MNIAYRRLSFSLILGGLLVALVSVSADFIGVGHTQISFGYRQVAGLTLGLFGILLGIVFLFEISPEKERSGISPEKTTRQSSSPNRTTVIALLLIVIMVGSVLRFWQLGHDSLWTDEMSLVNRSHWALIEIPSQLKQVEMPPLYYFLLHLLLNIGDNETIARLPAAIAGILAIPAMFVLGEALFDQWVGLAAAALLAISPFHLQYSQEARPYTLWLLFTLLSLYFIVRAWQTNKSIVWAGVVLSNLLAWYSHYFAVMVIFGEIVFIAILTVAELVSIHWKFGTRLSWTVKKLLSSLRQPQLSLHTGSTSSDKNIVSLAGRLRRALFSFVAIAILYIPWLPIMYHNEGLIRRARRAQHFKGFAAVLTNNFVPNTLAELAVGRYRMAWLQDMWPLYLCIGVFVFGWLLSIFRRRWRSALLTPLVVLPPFLLPMVVQDWMFPARYFISVLPILILNIAYALQSVVSALIVTISGSRVRDYGLAGTMLVVGLGLWVFNKPISYNYAWEKEDWRSAATYIVQEAQPEDIVLCDGEYLGRGGDEGRCFGGLSFYLRRTQRAGLGILHPIRVSHLAEEMPTLDGRPRDVWVVLFHQSHLKPLGREHSNVTITQFRDVAILHDSHPVVSTSDRLIGMIQALIDVQPRQESLRDLQGALLDVYRTTGEGAKLESLLHSIGLPSSPQDRASAYFQLGNFYWDHKLYDYAIQAYEKTLYLHPDFVEPANRLGYLYLRKGQVEEAVIVLEKAVALNPDSFWAHQLLGNAYRRQGRTVDAVREYKEALRIDPSNTLARQSIEGMQTVEP